MAATLIATAIAVAAPPAVMHATHTPFPSDLTTVELILDETRDERQELLRKVQDALNAWADDTKRRREAGEDYQQREAAEAHQRRAGEQPAPKP